MSTAKRLAKNTMFMYARMGVLMLISLYTSRVVLQQLGVDDYGTYNLVGSIVAMFSSLRALFSNSTQRFLNYEMGKGNNGRLKLVFNIGISINLIIAVAFVIAAEILGYWFLNYKMVIDPSRLFAAKVVFQFSILSAVISMITTPFDALIIAHERMDFFAYFAILEGVLRLVVVFLLSSFAFDKLIFYGFLQLAVSILVIILIALFCRKSFSECRFSRCFDKSLFKEMAAFAGWNFLGNTAYTLVQNGLNMVLNVFSGLAANAARGIAYQVNSALSKALDSVTTVVNPFCTKIYASGEFDKMLKMMYVSTKIYFVIQSLIVLPFCILAYEILNLWLGQVPEYSVGFMQLVLLFSLIRSVHYPINNLFKSAGILKNYQIAELIILSLPLLASYLLLKIGMSPYFLFISIIFFEFINYCAIIKIAGKDVNLPVKEYLSKALFPCFVSLLISAVFFAMSLHYKGQVVALIAVSVISMLVVSLFFLFIGFSKEERSWLLSIIRK